MPRTLAGVDITGSMVCTLIAEIKGDGQMEVLGAGMAPSNSVLRGSVIDQGALSDAIRQAMDKAKKNTAGVDRKVKDTINTLVERGKVLDDRAKKSKKSAEQSVKAKVDETVKSIMTVSKKAREKQDKIFNNIKNKAKKGMNIDEDSINKKIEESLDKLNVPTEEDLKRINTKLDELVKRLEKEE